jgi:hypothetical protein
MIQVVLVGTMLMESALSSTRKILGVKEQFGFQVLSIMR